MTPWHVYTLTDPRTGRVRYVGATYSLRQRFTAHRSYQTTMPGPRRAWMEELKAAGLKPRCDVLESGKHLTFADERKWIAYYLACGAELVNVVGTPVYKRHPPKAEQIGVRVAAFRAQRLAWRREYCLIVAPEAPAEHPDSGISLDELL